MKAYHFSEMPYPYVPEEVEKSYHSARVILPSSYMDPVKLADLYERYLDDYVYADDLGLDLMLNEHHQTMTCLAPVVPITASAVVQRTKRSKICILGSPLPHRDNPVRVAEEIAMLDVMSRGRIISGFVRGVPTEIQPANTNPVLTRQRFEEAHDLILKAWTTHEPFNWEGRFWHFRYVNVWPRTYQEPHPPVWITGSTPDSVTFTADHQYTYACFLTPYEWTEMLVKTYKQRCAEMATRSLVPTSSPIWPWCTSATPRRMPRSTARSCCGTCIASGTHSSMRPRATCRRRCWPTIS